MQINNYPALKNRIALGFGASPSTLKINLTGNNVNYSVGYKPIGAISYDRRLDYNTFLGVELLSNQTYLLRIGEEF